MPKHNTYNDSFTGIADSSIQRILFDNEDSSSQKLRQVLLKVINNELTTRQKEIIMLYYFKGIKTVTIGEQLGISQQAVSRVLSRARLNMYRILQYYI